MRPPLPTSPFAPRITSISDRTVVYQKLLSLSGEIGEALSRPIDGTLTINHTSDAACPPTSWPVFESTFKALVYLSPGWNNIRIDFTSPKLASKDGTSNPAHSTFIAINYLPLTNTPPLQLVMLLAKDSPGTFDAPPDRVEREGNTLDIAIRKYRMAAHLWQAFTAEQMFRNGFGRRCFRFEEEWQTGTLSARDWESNRMKNEARVHVVRCDKTVAELRDLNLAQQHKGATKNGELFTIAKDAVKQHFNPGFGQKQHVAVLLLDAHWDTAAQTIVGHAALGGGADNIQLAVFGSHALHTYPSCIEDVVPTFSDCTRTDTNFVANDCNESGTTWEAANIGIGAHLHEVGHLFGCPHQESGIMLRDYVRFNRTFMVREYFSSRTNQDGQLVCQKDDECAWHRLDLLRFRFHPCFRLPSDVAVNPDDSIQVWPVEDNRMIITAASGVAFIEIYPEGEGDLCHSWLEFISESKPTLSGQVSVTESELRSRLPESARGKKLRLELFSGAMGKQSVDDFGALFSKESRVDIPEMRMHEKRGGLNKLVLEPFMKQKGYRSNKLGFSDMEGTKPDEVILDASHIRSKLLTSIKVYHGFALDGIEFCYEDGESQLFGTTGGKPGGDEFCLDTRRSETLMGFYVRAGKWIDGVQLLTSQGRRSEFYGNAQGGSGHTLIPPRGYHLAGISGTVGRWVDGFQVVITRA